MAVVGASGWALGPERVDPTLAHLGALGGVLADLGYDVYAGTSLHEVDVPPVFVGWVGGEETAAEHDELVALAVPGSRSVPVSTGLETWSSVRPEDHASSIEFVRTALSEIRRLTEGDGPGEPRSPALSFYCFFYRAGRYGGTRDGTSRVRCDRATPAQGHHLVRAGTGRTGVRRS